MRKRDDAFREAAIGNLATYLDVRPGALTVLYQDAYADIVQELTGFLQWRGRPVESHSVSTLSLDGISRALDAAEKFLCCFNREFGNDDDDRVLRMIHHGSEPNGRGRAYTLTNINQKFWDIFQEPPPNICNLNSRLERALAGGKRLIVKDGNGTLLEIELNSKYNFVHIDGYQDAAQNLTVNLPPGEVATYSDNVSGDIWFRGGLLGTIPIGRKYGFIDAPILFEIRGNRVMDVRCDCNELKADLLYCLDFTEHTRNVCEIGFGTNRSIRTLTGLNYSFEEKHYGFHLGFGATLAQQNVQRETDHHLDLLFSECILELDGRVVFDGEYRV